MDRKEIGQPTMAVSIFMRMAAIIMGMLVRVRGMNRSTPTMHHAMHQAQQRRKQQRQSQIAPCRPPCHAPERHSPYFTVTASVMR
ncbi:MAG: hypothetical protein M3Q12_01695 [Pseudomonadota bacterium]|nr:hypothetical protein [Pseudomonadota bacterium]